MLVFNFTSCKSKKLISNNHFYEIINSEINHFTLNARENICLSNKLTHSILGHLNDLKYDPEYYEFHYLTTFYSLPKNEFQYLFSEEQINYYKTHFREGSTIRNDKLKGHNFSIVDVEKTDLKFLNKTLIVLSRPIFTKNNEYALIQYYHGNYMRNEGSEGITIYKKKSGKWIVYKRLLLGVV